MNLKLGKKPAKYDKRTIRLRTILKTLPPVPEYFSVDSTICDVPTPMFANDRYGDCVIAARAHQTLRFEAFEQKCAIAISDDEVLKEYWEEGCPIAPWLKPDRGLVMLYSLNDWRKSGWKIGDKEYTIYAYASTDTNGEVKAAIRYLGGVNIGITVTQGAMDQFNAGKTWDGSGDLTKLGGHAIYLYAYDNDGLWCVTWGKRQYMTWAFFNRFCDEAYALVDNRNIWMPDSPVDVLKLNDILDQITR